ncbi:AI-2E family transporter [Parapedobacter sp. ISTM3]|uniref:Predicted PurR-regulated permease PerM n=1 Tax=Parapedobacter luteus TaxID=623280 RepID=A0A1T5AJ09_9SPHI|nr:MULTISPECIES: AI-2E family transporter [Parapedobacter]MBK1441757.1 AI-2E family transporter [Parapedobacter sp. ISTM3]SKB34984.1 Predicted PurR-regulated permease PerM [Parapedobacter luteus]
MQETPTKRPYALELAATLFALALIIALMYALQSVLVPLMFSILIAISLYPVARFLERLRFGKAFSALLAVILAIAIISGLIWFIIHQVIVIGRDGTEIQSKFLSIFDTIQRWLHDRFGLEPTEVAERLRGQANQFLSNAASHITAAFGSIGNLLAGAVLVPLFSFFLLYYRVFFREFFFRAFKSTPQERVHNTLNKIYTVVQSYLLGLVTVMGIVAILNTVGLLLMGIQYAWFFGTLASLLMLLPYIGIAIGSILPALFALATKDSSWYAIGVIAWFQVVQFLEGNVITPNIVGGKVSINPLMAIISILLGGMLFGLAGLILALPITATIKVLFDAIPSMNAFGFLIGEPEKYHLKRYSTKILLKRWNLRDLLEAKERKMKEEIERKAEEPDSGKQE